MSLRLNVQIRNQEVLQDALRKLSGAQAKSAYALALNDAGGKLQRAFRAEYRAAFNAPTPYIFNSPWVTRATPEKLSVAVGPRNMKKSGVDPQKILQAQEFGGTRRDKRFEVALKRMGVLPNGMQVAIQACPASPCGAGSAAIAAECNKRPLSCAPALISTTW